MKPLEIVKNQGLAEKGYTSSVANSGPFVNVSAEIIRIKGETKVFAVYHLYKDNQLIKKIPEEYVVRRNQTEDEVFRAITLKAASLLNKRGTVFYTFNGLENVILHNLFGVSFKKIGPSENETYPIVQDNVKQAFMNTYKREGILI